MRCMLALSAFLPAAAFAGAWSRDLGHLYAKIGGSFFEASGATPLGGRGGVERQAEFASQYFALYTEVGLGGGAQISVTLPYARNSNRFPDGRVERREGFADLGASLSYGWKRDAWALSFAAGAVLPLYSRGDDVPAGQPLPLAPELGDGRYDLLLVATLGHSFWPTPAWIEVELGHRLRMGELAGGLLAGVRGGYTFFGRLLAMAELRIQRAYGASDAARPVVRPPDYVIAEPKLILRLVAGIALELSGGAALLRVSRDPGAFVSVAISFEH